MFQNIIAISISLASVVYLGWGAFVTLTGKKSKLGSCCAKGCGGQPVDKKTEPQVQFLPIDLLTRRK